MVTRGIDFVIEQGEDAVVVNLFFFFFPLGENRTLIDALHPHVTVTSGQKAMLTCRLDATNADLSLSSSSSSSYQLIWIRQHFLASEVDSLLGHNQDLLIADPRLTIQRTDIDYSLIISEVNSDDQGVYACEINSQPPERAVIHLHIQGEC